MPDIKTDITVTLTMEDVHEMVKDFLIKKNLIKELNQEFRVDHIIRAEEIPWGTHDCTYKNHFAGLKVMIP